jgi:hypothetical protein
MDSGHIGTHGIHDIGQRYGDSKHAEGQRHLPQEDRQG